MRFEGKTAQVTGAAGAIGRTIEHHRRKRRFFSRVEQVNALEQVKANWMTGKYTLVACISLRNS